jgi:hypothetical protein
MYKGVTKIDDARDAFWMVQPPHPTERFSSTDR